MIINKPYSFNTLASVISSLEWGSDIIDLSKIDFLFTDADVSVNGKLIGTFNIQKQTYEYPPYSDLVNIYIDISSVLISGEQKEIIYNWEEKEKLVKSVKDLLI